MAATLSTSGVGSTPGNKTKNTGILLEVSSNRSKTSNAGYSIYFSPIFSITKLDNADVNLSGLIALSNSNLWNLEISLYAFGKSDTSALSS